MNANELILDILSSCVELGGNGYGVDVKFYTHGKNKSIMVWAGDTGTIGDCLSDKNGFFGITYNGTAESINQLMQLKADLVEHHKIFRLNNPD